MKIPNNQESASAIYTPTKCGDKELICLTCDMKKCRPTACKRYNEKIKKLEGKV